jgi:hypothetical protein
MAEADGRRCSLSVRAVQKADQPLSRRENLVADDQRKLRVKRCGRILGRIVQSWKHGPWRLDEASPAGENQVDLDRLPADRGATQRRRRGIRDRGGSRRRQAQRPTAVSLSVQIAQMDLVFYLHGIILNV